MSETSSVLEAQRVIEDIRTSRHVDDADDWNAADLSRSLDM